MYLLISSATEWVINSYSQSPAIKSVLPDTIKSVSVDASNPPPNTQGTLPFKGCCRTPEERVLIRCPQIPAAPQSLVESLSHPSRIIHAGVVQF
ncbi:hypothetical protein CEXT_800441 [Caerostris extrusa]|uniref:Uncharacterized protein n=1 Tax=Caerostris extrusa TaxID=172846 RepID=A0AAV4RG49_CAEEX|nr:hypothetical protein CEXT_800441 [Caerostris extrusa]